MRRSILCPLTVSGLLHDANVSMLTNYLPLFLLCLSLCTAPAEFPFLKADDLQKMNDKTENVLTLILGVNDRILFCFINAFLRYFGELSPPKKLMSCKPLKSLK